MTRFVVLGRFQPFHNGHHYLVEKAIALAKDSDEVIVAVGSSQLQYEPNNPWTAEERVAMISSWADKNNYKITIVTIEDINDAPNWVSHASNSHGEGTLVTSDGPTAQLYKQAGWPIEIIEMSQRKDLEGWRIRQTLKMLSTVYDDDATRQVTASSLPSSVVEWLIENDAIYRLSTFETGFHAG
mgnify:FL=1